VVHAPEGLVQGAGPIGGRVVRIARVLQRFPEFVEFQRFEEFRRVVLVGRFEEFRRRAQRGRRRGTGVLTGCGRAPGGGA